MAYTQLTFAQLVTALSIRLGDAGKIFWIEAELESYLKEALRTWQAFSQFTAAQGSFNTAANTRFYDIYAQIPALQPTITDQDILQDIQRALQEPVSATSWPGNTDQFSLAGVTAAIQKRRDKFFIETGMYQSFSEVTGPTVGVAELELNQATIDVRRAAYKTGGIYNLLWPADTFMLTAGSQTWASVDGPPTDYTTFFGTPPTILVAPAPSAATSFLNLITVDSGADLDPASGPTVLGVPDDFCWIIKFGALADLLGQDGPGQDVGRANYCESRWEDGLKLARITSFVRLGYSTGTPSFLSSMEELDSTDPDWMNEAAGTPESIALSGNILATQPIPNGVYAMSFTIVPKFPVPVLTTDYIQVGQELVDSILDYAQHLAAFKEGDGSIQDTMPNYQSLVKQAALENDILRARATDFDVLSDRETLEAKERPRRRSDIIQQTAAPLQS